MIGVRKKNYEFILKLFPLLIESGTITKEESSKILSSLSPLSFDWKRLARYSLWTAVISLFIAVMTILNTQWFIQLLNHLFTAPIKAKIIGSSIFATIFYTFGLILKTRKPQNVYTNEIILFLAVLTTAGAIFWLGDFIGLNSNHFSVLILFASICYGILGFLLQSKLIWFFSLLSLAGWLAAETGYMSDWEAYFLGLNYPLRFAFFGLVSLLSTIGLRHNTTFQPFYNVTRNMGLFYLFLALWILSIFGNYGDLSAWHQVKQIKLFHWSLLFGGASAVAIYLGCKWDESSYRSFGITFLFINLYTRFFELFWNSLHTTIFFSLLAVSFWYLGSKAEKIWFKKERLFCKKDSGKE